MDLRTGYSPPDDQGRWAMSARAERVRRRAEQRAQERDVLRRVLGGTNHGHGACIAPGCEGTGPVVTVGVMHVTLCRRHKRAFDAAWAAGVRPREPAA